MKSLAQHFSEVVSKSIQCSEEEPQHIARQVLIAAGARYQVIQRQDGSCWTKYRMPDRSILNVKTVAGQCSVEVE